MFRHPAEALSIATRTTCPLLLWLVTALTHHYPADPHPTVPHPTVGTPTTPSASSTGAQPLCTRKRRTHQQCRCPPWCRWLCLPACYPPNPRLASWGPGAQSRGGGRCRQPAPMWMARASRRDCVSVARSRRAVGRRALQGSKLAAGPSCCVLRAQAAGSGCAWTSPRRANVMRRRAGRPMSRAAGRPGALPRTRGNDDQSKPKLQETKGPSSRGWQRQRHARSTTHNHRKRSNSATHAHTKTHAHTLQVRRHHECRHTHTLRNTHGTVE